MRPEIGPIPDHDCSLTPADACPSPLARLWDRVTSNAHVRPGRRAASGHAPRLTPLGAPAPRRRTAAVHLYKREREAKGLHTPPKPYNLFSSPSSSTVQPLDSFRSHAQMASLPESRVRGDVLEGVQSLGPDMLTLWEGGSASVPQPRAGE